MKPEWCEHQDCTCLHWKPDTTCAGRLAEPQDHVHQRINTHRFCIRHSQETDLPFLYTFDLCEADVYWMIRTLDLINCDRGDSMIVIGGCEETTRLMRFWKEKESLPLAKEAP